MSTKKDFCFVIMPFKKDMQEVYDDVIKPAVEEAGIACIRADELVGAASIIRKIIEHIYDAKIVIADMTGKNANVFYELGIAHALGNNTIVISQEEPPFDHKSYKVIMYENTIGGGRKLHKELVQNIKTVDEWSTVPTNPVWDFLPGETKEKVPVFEFDKLKSELEAKQKLLDEVQKQLKDMQRDKAMIDSLKAKSEELEHLRNILKGLLPPELLQGKSDVVKVMEEINNKFEVSVDESSNQSGEKSKKLTFRKVN